jgi:ATP-dependent helicase/nuclease subunit B
MHTGIIIGMHFCVRGISMVEFITGQAGSGKTTLMFERIRNSASDGSHQCIIVPEQYSYEFDKTLYFYLGA